MILSLPWPDSKLSPNCAKHWRSKQSAKEKYRDDCYILALSCKPNLPEGNIPLSIVFHPPTKRRFDLDNRLAAIKYGLDSVAKAWGVDDIRFRPITVDMGAPVKGGKVVLEVG